MKYSMNNKDVKKKICMREKDELHRQVERRKPWERWEEVHTQI